MYNVCASGAPCRASAGLVALITLSEPAAPGGACNKVYLSHTCGAARVGPSEHGGPEAPAGRALRPGSRGCGGADHAAAAGRSPRLQMLGAAVLAAEARSLQAPRVCRMSDLAHHRPNERLAAHCCARAAAVVPTPHVVSSTRHLVLWDCAPTAARKAGRCVILRSQPAGDFGELG